MMQCVVLAFSQRLQANTHEHAASARCARARGSPPASSSLGTARRAEIGTRRRARVIAQVTAVHGFAEPVSQPVPLIDRYADEDTLQRLALLIAARQFRHPQNRPQHVVFPLGPDSAPFRCDPRVEVGAILSIACCLPKQVADLVRSEL